MQIKTKSFQIEFAPNSNHEKQKQKNKLLTFNNIYIIQTKPNHHINSNRNEMKKL